MSNRTVPFCPCIHTAPFSPCGTVVGYYMLVLVFYCFIKLKHRKKNRKNVPFFVGHRKGTKRHQKAPKGTKRHQKAPKGTKRHQKAPKGTKRHQKAPKNLCVQKPF